MRYPFPVEKTAQKASKVTSEAIDYAELNAHENKIFNQHFKLPEAPLFPARLNVILVMLHNICCTIVPAKNVLIKQQQKQLQDCIERVFQPLTSNAQTNTKALHKRSDLRQYLMDYPLYSALLLLDNRIIDEEEKCWWMALLARIYLHHQSITYDASLNFDRAQENRPSLTQLNNTLSISDLFSATRIEIQAALKQLSQTHVGFKKIIGLFANVKEANRPSIFETPNKLSCDHAELDEERITLHTNVDLDGEVQQQYLEIESAASLPEKAKQAKFRKALQGKQNAIRRANIALPHSLQALTPLQLKQLIEHAMPQLTAGTLNQIPCNELPFFIIFWMEIWLNKPLSSFTNIGVFNAGSRTLKRDQPGIYYSLDHAKYQHTHMFYQINTQLVKGKLPKSDDEQYYDSSNSPLPVQLIIPFPLQSLFNIYLREIDSSHRRQTDLAQLLKVSDQDYNQWLNQKISAVSAINHQRITRSMIRKTFHHFINDSVPNSNIALLQQVGVLQSFYVNTDPDSANYHLHSGWLRFLKLLDLDKKHRSTTESDNSLLPSFKNSQQAFGAALCIKADYLSQISYFFLQEFSQFMPLSSINIQHSLPQISHLLVRTMHFPSAISAMIRPVIQPYPAMQHINTQQGYMTVRDKDAHRNQERRIVFFDRQLTALWAQLTQWYSLQAFSKITEHTLCYHNTRKWVNVDKYNLADLMENFNIPVDANAYRQSGASLFIEAYSVGFQQQIINMQMNHFNYGQSPLHLYSLLSISQTVNMQQTYLTSLTAPFVEVDKMLQALLNKLITKKQRLINEYT